MTRLLVVLLDASDVFNDFMIPQDAYIESIPIYSRIGSDYHGIACILMHVITVLLAYSCILSRYCLHTHAYYHGIACILMHIITVLLAYSCILSQYCYPLAGQSNSCVSINDLQHI